MARMQKSKGRTGGGWKAKTDDAIRLAALRWFAIRIESATIQLYATHQSNYENIERVLRSTMQQLSALAKKSPIGTEECPEGYMECKDGTCAPMCNPFGDGGGNEQ